MRAPAFAVPALALASLAACATPGGVPFLAPPSTPVEVSEAQARRFVEVVDRVEPVAERECRDRNPPEVDCDLRIVVDDREGMPANAFQTLDSRGRPLLGFTIALIAEARNEDELAFVVSHEASHHILGHLARQDEVAAAGAKAFGRVASEEAGATTASIRRAQEVGAAVGARAFSKEWELEADALGAVVAQEAGFDPIRGAEFFLRIADPGDQVLGTHPRNADRIAIVQAVVAGTVVP